MQNRKEQVWLVYDGECPLCNAFAKVAQIRESVGDFQIINARQEHPIIQEINARKLNLDEGIVLKFNDNFYYGADALHRLALLSTNHHWINRMNGFIFRSKLLSKLLYPVLRYMRNCLLCFKGVNKINNLGK